MCWTDGSEDGGRRRRPRRTLRSLLWAVLDRLDSIGEQLADANRHINKIEKRLEIHMSETQDRLDAITTQLSDVSTSLDEAATGIRTDIEALKAQVEAGQTPDFTALDARVAALTDQATALKALDEENPAPAPEPPTD